MKCLSLESIFLLELDFFLHCASQHFLCFSLCTLPFWVFYCCQSVSSVTQSCLTLCDPMNRSTAGLPVHHQLPEFTQAHVHGVGDAIQPSHPLSSSSPPAPNPSQHQGLFNESTLRMRWPKYWSFSFSISPSSEHPGLISFRMDWLDLLAVQGTLKSLLQQHILKASILRGSVFFTVQLSHPYMTTGKTIGALIALYYNYSQFLAAPWVQEPWISYICIHSAYCLAQCCQIEMKCALHTQY